MTPPLAVDVDGTLTRPGEEGLAVDPRAMEALRGWDAPVVVATGKAFPYPVGLCDFVGIPVRVVAENGGVVCVDGEVRIPGDDAAARAVADAYHEAGHDLGWGPADLVNRWRETEVAVARERPLAPLEELAAEHGLAVVDSGYAYHVVDPAVDKGTGLAAACEVLDRDPGSFVAVGDSANDVGTFEAVGRAFAVANADDAARAAADEVVEAPEAEGLVAALERVRED
jgi:phosphoglycolate phosphatase (TIGR01487 family)